MMVATTAASREQTMVDSMVDLRVVTRVDLTVATMAVL
jgi:hypothetical protein